MHTWGLTRAEQAALVRLRTPPRIQRFLDELPYNLEPHGATCYSPRLVLRHGTAHCMEGALAAAAALRFAGYPALLVDLEAVQDVDHVLAVYRGPGGWGALAKSNFAGLRSREPVYRTLRELALSYFEHYFNLRREKTLRAFSRPVNLARFDRRGWMSAEENVWYIPEHLCAIPHTPLLRPGIEQELARMDRRLFEAGLHGSARH